MEFIENLNEYNYLYRFAIYGKSTTGKTHLANRLKLYNDYSKFIDCKEKIRITTGIDFTIFCIKYKNKIIKIQ